jgi:mannose-6-phosphate isomerase-like protein (cupin superfamily)
VTVVAAEGQRPRAPRVSGSTVTIVVDATVPGADMHAGINVLAPGFEIPLHWHSVGELQFILSGTGIAIDANGRHVRVSPGDTVFGPAGRPGAHGFMNTGDVPLAVLFAYPSPGGEPPDLTFVDSARTSS